jgi:hypothetical protein
MTKRKRPTLVSLQAMMAVIEKHKVEPINGEYMITDKMMKEAGELDKAWRDRGDKRGKPISPESLEDFIATIEGKPNSGNWKPADEEGDL